MVYLTRRERFSAAHRLHNPEWTDEKNAKVFGLCNNPNGHGHNYEIEVTVASVPNKGTGMVMDLKDLGKIIEEVITLRVDHKHLNFDVPFLSGINPTVENMAIVFWGLLNPVIKDARLYQIRLYESENNFVEYRGE